MSSPSVIPRDIDGTKGTSNTMVLSVSKQSPLPEMRGLTGRERSDPKLIAAPWSVSTAFGGCYPPTGHRKKCLHTLEREGKC